MSDQAALLRDARARAGLSTRELARLAGVSASTVSRIESGATDPTVGTLRRLVTAAGFDLGLSTRPISASGTAASSIRSAQPPALADLYDAWSSSPTGPRPDWTRVRILLEHLDRHPEQVAAAIKAPPRRTRSAMMNALLAGIADKLADDAGLPNPSWTQAAGALRRCWYSPGTPRMRAASREHAPEQLLRRNLAIHEDSLWRPREPRGTDG
ncbi:MAG: helix-turn-helix domain-containing protein [Actinomycetes bacterium]